MTDDDPTRVAFVCVQNAGRSQMATAFAERERRDRAVEDEIEITTGGTQPADGVHDEVIAVMDEKGFDLRDRTPREVTPGDLRACDYVITMGCSAQDVCPAARGGESRDWDLTDPDGRGLDAVREIRDDVAGRVSDLFDEMLDERAATASE